jgi:putative PIN family toxin of toxin-antitoxin system
VARHGLGEEKIGRFLKLLATQAIMVETSETIAVVTDETDNRYLECATAAKASCIVSGDNHLLTVGAYKGIVILPPATFVALLEAGID